jgi:hypothetical protein
VATSEALGVLFGKVLVQFGGKRSIIAGGKHAFLFISRLDSGEHCYMSLLKSRKNSTLDIAATNKPHVGGS